MINWSCSLYVYYTISIDRIGSYKVPSMYALFKGAFNHFAIRQSYYKIYLILDKKITLMSAIN